MTPVAQVTESLATVASQLGFRRVQCVHLVKRDDRVQAEVTGVIHRYPRTVRVSLAAANRLVAAGAPVRVDYLEG